MYLKGGNLHSRMKSHSELDTSLTICRVTAVVCTKTSSKEGVPSVPLFLLLLLLPGLASHYHLYK